jgi:hypothetical protein
VPTLVESTGEKSTPTWQRLAALAYVAVGVAALVAFHSHLGPDFIPLDDSHVAPNILAEVVTVLVMTPIGVLLWPPTRRRIHRFMDRKLGVLHEHNEWAAREIAAMRLHVTGEHSAPHPHFKDIGKERNQ